MLIPVSNHFRVFPSHGPLALPIVIVCAVLLMMFLMPTNVLASESQSAEYGQQCADPRSDENLLKEYKTGDDTEGFVVLSPNKLLLKSGVEFQIVKSKSLGDIFVFGNSSSAGGNATVCGCQSGCAPRCNGRASGGIATCTGGCYKNGDPCLSCTFKKLDITLVPSPNPTN